MREYDFRFGGLGEIRPGDAENMRRVRRVRATLLAAAGGFTELPPEVCADLVSGDGMGYIVALSSKKKAQSLQRALAALARGWGLRPPRLREGAQGPRRAFSFILIPEKANPAAPRGYRRPLFRLSRWARIEKALGRIAPVRVELVYGEWLPARSARVPVGDDQRMYVVGRGAATKTTLAGFIRAHVFDKGIECDQECIYLSHGGKPVLVRER